jgi:hypothetical protein
MAKTNAQGGWCRAVQRQNGGAIAPIAANHPKLKRLTVRALAGGGLFTPGIYAAAGTRMTVGEGCLLSNPARNELLRLGTGNRSQVAGSLP